MDRALAQPVGPLIIARWALIGAGALALVTFNIAGLLQLAAIAPNGSTGDWYYFSQVDPTQPYAFEEFFRWAPITAWAWHLIVIPLGWHLWVLAHVAVLGFLRDWRVIALVLVSWPFWEDALNGNVLTFVLVAAWSALRGDRAGVAAFVVLCALMPRPLMLPVLAWLLWHRTDARWWLVGAGAFVLASSVALGQLDEWVARLILSSNEIASSYNIGPSAWIGAAWVPIGLALGAWLTWKGRLGLASLAVSPYWLAYYLLMPVLELRRLGAPPSMTRPAASPR